MTGRLLIGTSGWSYKGWHGDFYPADLPRKEELGYLSSFVTSSEINATFYRLQQRESFQRWYAATPPEHVFAVKGSRYITHLLRLRRSGPALEKFFESGVLELGDKLGVFLWQLPGTLEFDRSVVAEFLQALPHGYRHAFEPRHASWASDEAAELLAAYGVATVHSDSPRTWPVVDRDTADFRYVRLHGHSQLYASRYSERSLDLWADRCRVWSGAGQDVHVYFDNDARGHAPHDALRLLERVRGSAQERSALTQRSTG